ncbi:MAG TPA: hypothetical protein VIF09_16455 [Polyangiaceae bacterium]|jgi:hypothetical protein
MGCRVALVGLLAASAASIFLGCANGGPGDDFGQYEAPDGSLDGNGLSADVGGGGGDSGGGGRDTGSGGGDDGGGFVWDAGDDSGGAGCAPIDTCGSAATNLGSIAGDKSGATLTSSGSAPDFLLIDYAEKDSSIGPVPMKATVTLTSPAGTNFDLYAYLGASKGAIECTTVQQQSTNPAGQDDTVTFEWGETSGLTANGVDDSRTVTIEVRWASGTCSTAASWSLSAHGH